MSIRAVYRVQCDGCKGWLSRSDDYVMGTDVLVRHRVVRLTAETAFNWPGERAARLAAQEAGWEKHPHDTKQPCGWLCPACKHNPFDRGELPPPEHVRHPLPRKAP